MSVGLLVLIVGFGVGAICALFGVVRALAASRALKARVDAYRDLPVVALAVTTRLRVERAQRAAATVPLLRARARRALTELVGSLDALRTSGQTLIAAVRGLTASFFGR